MSQSCSVVMSSLRWSVATGRHRGRPVLWAVHPLQPAPCILITASRTMVRRPLR